MSTLVSRLVALAALVSGLALLAGCRSLGGSFLVFGGARVPQEPLIESVRDAGEATHDAQAEFATAFRLYQRLTAPQAPELAQLSKEYAESIDECAARVGELGERTDVARKEAEALFGGWNEELTRFSGDSLRKKSEAQLHESQAVTQRVLDALDRVQERARPVMLALHDYALFFHHNLNARAIATLQDTYPQFDGECRALEQELARVQAEIDGFLEHHGEAVKPAVRAE